ncbi:MAG: ribose-phosphate diphosphokinase [Dehalococcoidia bacterium]|nr:ribose-phosphate diphosphokinase [Dehalococcoidia bacterium]
MSRDLLLFSGRVHEELTHAIARHLGVAVGARQIFNFSNGNTFCKYEEVIRNRDVFIVQPGAPTATGSVNDSMMELFMMVDAARRASAWRVTVVMPYYAYGRTDKKDQPRVPITARLVADLLVASGINRILTLDLHAGQIQGFFPGTVGVDEVTAFYLICDYVHQLRLENLVVVATDLGFSKRANNFARALGADVAFVSKKRIGNTDRTESDTIVGDVAGRTALVVDDEIDTAGSMAGAVRLCVANGATSVYAAATHAVFSGPALERIAALPLRELIVTDTIPQHTRAHRLPFATVLSVAPLLAEAIRRIHYGESIGDLYAALFGDLLSVGVE